MLSFWWNFHHWLHWKLSSWQLPVQPVMKISSKWQHFRFSVDALAMQRARTSAVMVLIRQYKQVLFFYVWGRIWYASAITVLRNYLKCRYIFYVSPNWFSMTRVKALRNGDNDRSCPWPGLWFRQNGFQLWVIKQAGVGVTKALFVNFCLIKNFRSCESYC